MINKKLVGRKISGRYVAVDWEFLHLCLSGWLSRVYVDGDWYLQFYPDVLDAVRRGVVPSARDHYINDGFYEHRFPYKITVDEKFYYEAYPDVQEACAEKAFESAQHHFETYGYREGRLPFRDFHLLTQAETVRRVPKSRQVPERV